jgi:proline iminopeptidase
VAPGQNPAVNSEVAAPWAVKIKKPFKQFVCFEDTGHMPMTEEPGKFRVSLLRYARPIAGRVSDAVPSGG